MNGIKEWFPLYASDWLTSIGLRLCSPFARGILIDMMAYSWESKTPGVIIDTPADLSLFFHCTEEAFSNATAELEDRNCIVRDNGHIYIPKLQTVGREQREKHLRRVEAGRKGGLAKAENSTPEDGSASNALAKSSNALAIEEKRVDKSREECQQKKHENADSVIDYLNEKVGSRYQHSKTSRTPISARLSDGFTVDDCRLVIDLKVEQWEKDPKMCEFIRPSTLFAPSHFEEYLNAAILKRDKPGNINYKKVN